MAATPPPMAGAHWKPALQVAAPPPAAAQHRWSIAPHGSQTAAAPPIPVFEQVNPASQVPPAPPQQAAPDPPQVTHMPPPAAVAPMQVPPAWQTAPAQQVSPIAPQATQVLGI